MHLYLNIYVRTRRAERKEKLETARKGIPRRNQIETANLDQKKIASQEQKEIASQEQNGIASQDQKEIDAQGILQIDRVIEVKDIFMGKLIYMLEDL